MYQSNSLLSQVVFIILAMAMAFSTMAIGPAAMARPSHHPHSLAVKDLSNHGQWSKARHAWRDCNPKKASAHRRGLRKIECRDRKQNAALRDHR